MKLGALLIQLLITMGIATQTFANTPKIVSCNKIETKLLIKGHKKGQQVMSQLLSEISKTIIDLGGFPDDDVDDEDYDDSEPILNQLHNSKIILECAQQRSKSLYYQCVSDPNVQYYMRTMPMIGSKVKVASVYLRSGNYQISSAAIHEATHKCGTTDADYFSTNNKPHDIWFSIWSQTASTYDYWADEGFCIPEENC